MVAGGSLRAVAVALRRPPNEDGDQGEQGIGSGEHQGGDAKGSNQQMQYGQGSSRAQSMGPPGQAASPFPMALRNSLWGRPHCVPDHIAIRSNSKNCTTVL